jgi:hypothetical protein
VRCRASSRPESLRSTTTELRRPRQQRFRLVQERVDRPAIQLISTATTSYRPVSERLSYL